ncbi:MAG: bifunctional nicotinamidase/pyrazinamidase, partial [Planctomycetota bacterium]
MNGQPETLLLIDVQHDFLPGGALSVPQADEILPVIERAIASANHVVATQDWHPPDHGSFASQQAGIAIGDMFELHGLPQVAWPDHCVQHTRGAEFAPVVDLGRVCHVVLKGTEREIDSYSGFFDNGHRRSTGLHDYLKSVGTTRLRVLGLATDYCVKFT